MRGSLGHRRANQLKLFHPPPRTPRWHTLAPEVRQRTVKLLALMLRQHAGARAVPDAAEGPGDE